MTEPNDASGLAAERAESAGRRARELGERLTRLAAGHGSDDVDLDEARDRAQQAAVHARVSRERARAGHERAAQTHERTAQVHERAALSDADHREAHLRAADEHRQAAVADAAAGRAGGDGDPS
jgi:DNA-binding helix-hairpin-helix protein with protein kinase domain